MSHDVFFSPGRAGNVDEWYERADLCVMSSRLLGFPNTLGLPAVSFGCDNLFAFRDTENFAVRMGLRA